MSILAFAYQAACMAVFWSCFCRFVRMDSTTEPLVRFAFWQLSLASIVCMVAPHFGWSEPSWPAVLALVAIAATQAITSHYWRRGTPDRFKKGERNETAR